MLTSSPDEDPLLGEIISLSHIISMKPMKTLPALRKITSSWKIGGPAIFSPSKKADKCFFSKSHLFRNATNGTKTAKLHYLLACCFFFVFFYHMSLPLHFLRKIQNCWQQLNVRCQRFFPAPENPSHTLSFLRYVEVCGFSLSPHTWQEHLTKCHRMYSFNSGDKRYLQRLREINVSALYLDLTQREQFVSTSKWRQCSLALITSNPNELESAVCLPVRRGSRGTPGYNLPKVEQPDTTAIFGNIIFANQ